MSALLRLSVVFSTVVLAIGCTPPQLLKFSTWGAADRAIPTIYPGTCQG